MSLGADKVQNDKEAMADKHKKLCATREQNDSSTTPGGIMRQNTSQE
jgi:hypothetical protein